MHIYIMPTHICEICKTTFESQKSVKTCSKDCSYKLRNVTRNTQHEPIEKLCISCGHTFLDVSKKKLVKKCKTCVYSSMVDKRKATGSYTPTEEQRVARSLAMIEKHKVCEYFTDLSRHKLSEKAKERWRSEEFRSRYKHNNVLKYGVEHWTQTPEGKKKISERARKYRATEETKAKLRLSAAKRLREGRNKCSFLGKGGVRNDIGFYVRSKWEANFARYLSYTNQEFEYETTSFSLSDGRTYTPDFKVGDIFFEIKGWWTSTAIEKYRLFCEQYPNVIVQIVDEVVYRKLTDQYGHVIPNWER